MQLIVVTRTSGLLASIFSLSLSIPLLVGLWYGEDVSSNFALPMAVTLFLGVLLWFPGRQSTLRISRRDGFLIVAMFWGLLSLMGAWPLFMALNISPLEALFESASAITTTGATILTGLDALPRSVLFFRQELQWMGGMGLIVLGIAVLPMLGIGGMQLYRAEAPGPMKEEKMTPRLASTARALWLIYLSLTAACAFAYWLFGMEPFDAIAHSLSTVSTGGFSTHDDSLSWFHSSQIEGVAILFMLLASLNFGVHYYAIYRRKPLHYWEDIEARSFLILVLVLVVVVGMMLWMEGNYLSLPTSLRDASFEVVSVITSTGFGTVDFSRWPDFLPVLLIFVSFIGGCGGSTAGGMKVLRVVLLFKQGMREIRKLIHPNAILPVYLGRHVVDQRIMNAVWGFFAAYTVVFVVLMLLMIHAGLDQVSAFSAVATCMNNLGPGLGKVANNFQEVSSLGKGIAILAMLLGRLEIFTILILLTPAFWKD
ncbi:TrkH family potassium uptake protein [Thiolapillus sp.]